VQVVEFVDQAGELVVGFKPLPLVVGLGVVGARHGLVLRDRHLLPRAVWQQVARAWVVRLAAGDDVQVEVIVAGFDGVDFDLGELLSKLRRG
jgi:hypothetical protein